MTYWLQARAFFTRCFMLLMIVAIAAPAGAQETVSYTYDALGRLVTVSHGTAGPNANISSSYIYDAAQNRTREVVSTPITLAPSLLAQGTAGSSFSERITATGGAAPYVYSAAESLPPGLTLDSSSGILSGTPTTAGGYNFTIIATDAVGHGGAQAYSFTVNPNPNTVTISPPTLPNGTVKVRYSQTFSATGGVGPKYTYSLFSGSLPPGITLSYGNGAILSGIPTAAGTYTFTIMAVATMSGAGTQQYTVVISP